MGSFQSTQDASSIVVERCLQQQKHSEETGATHKYDDLDRRRIGDFLALFTPHESLSRELMARFAVPLPVEVSKGMGTVRMRCVTERR